MSDTASGIVTAIELKQGNNDSYRCTIVVGGYKYSTFVKENALSDKNGVAVIEGDRVEFPYTEQSSNGRSYKNFYQNNLVVTEKAITNKMLLEEIAANRAAILALIGIAKGVDPGKINDKMLAMKTNELLNKMK